MVPSKGNKQHDLTWGGMKYSGRWEWKRQERSGRGGWMEMKQGVSQEADYIK